MRENSYDVESFRDLAGYIIEAEKKMKQEYPVSIILEENVKAFEDMYEDIKRVFRNQKDVVIEKHMDIPNDNMGFIRVKGQWFDIRNTLSFLKAIGRNSMIEIYAKTDNALWMDITVHNLTKRVKEQENE